MIKTVTGWKGSARWSLEVGWFDCDLTFERSQPRVNLEYGAADRAPPCGDARGRQLGGAGWRASRGVGEPGEAPPREQAPRGADSPRPRLGV